jgi:antitoxin ChpS
MLRVQLRKVGGSVMLTVPPAILQQLGLGPGATVGIDVEDGRLIIEPAPKRRYSLDELLARCDPSAPRGEEDSVWLGDAPVGSELL